MVSMIVGTRITERLAAVGMSQSELARRVRLGQSTINGLINGDQRSSTKLHEIARELETTPAYLSGETDDPHSELPLPTPLASDARELMENFSAMHPADRRALAQIAKTASALVASHRLQLPNENALTRMFEGLLEGIDPAEPRDQQALLLARRLPNALSLLQGLAPASPARLGQSPEAVKARLDRATRHREPT